LTSAALIAAAGCKVATGGDQDKPSAPTAAQQTQARTDIAGMMHASAQAWTHGDLDAFMDSYENGDSVTFVTPKGVVHGRSAIRARYAPRFAPGVAHDSLSFEDMEIDLLAPDVANVIAYYRLSRGDSTTSHGPTTVVMRHRDGKWRIIHDHSS
jgi:uncharacterized protein (TIGR02246 family)